MGMLTKTWEQITELFSSMTPGARLTAALLAVVIVISIGYLFTMSGDTSGEYLLAGRSFDGNEMARVQAAFGQAGLNGATIEGTKIKIPAGEEAKYLAAMASNGVLPQDFADIMENAMADLSPFSSRESRKHAIDVAMMKMLSQVIKYMDDSIERAQVVYSEVPARGLRNNGEKTAAVTIQSMHKHAEIDPSLAQAIRDTVTHSYAGLKSQNVSITFNGSPVINPADSLDPTMGGQERYFAAKKQHEATLEKKIRESMPWISGVQVAAYVDLDPTIFERQSSRELDDKKAGTLSESRTEQTTTSESNPAGGRPPAQAQGGSNTQVALTGTASGTKDETSNSESQTTSLPGHIDVVKETAGLTPTSVSVSVGVPDTYFIEQWKLQNADAGREPTETDWRALADTAFGEWKNHVLSQISTPNSAATANVTFTAFSPLPVPEMTEEAIADSAIGWLAQYGGTLGMVFLGLVGLLMIRSFVKSATKPSAAASEPAEEKEDDEATADPAQVKAARKWDASEGDVKQELAELVREDPDTAASILQGWITTPT